MYHIFFTCSSVDGHTGCFHVWLLWVGQHCFRFYCSAPLPWTLAWCPTGLFLPTFLSLQPPFSPSFLCFVFFPPLETPFVFSICHFVRATRISSRPGVSKFQDLMPNDLRWSWYNNNRHKAHNKCNALESSRNCSPLPPPLGWRKAVFCETVPWCQKSWGPRKITGFVVGADLGLNPGSAIPAVWLWAGQLTPFVSVSSYAKWEEQSLHLPW